MMTPSTTRPTRVAVLGSTGSIGTSTLDVIASQPDRLAVIGLAAKSRVELLEQQIARFHPAAVAVLDEAGADRLSARSNGTVVLRGVDGFVALVTRPDVDLVVIGTSGRDALRPLIEAIRAGKRVALASKELLVMAGALIMAMVREHRATLVPVDSEHAALAQVLRGIPPEHVERISVTGTGGPLWALDAEAIGRVTREQVLRHPKWRMGPKITVDSATLMNKGLEVIEAHWLFGIPLDRIHVVIHPQAAVHALVELSDGTCLAQMSICDMRLPIQYALSFPDRWAAALPRLRLTELDGLQFFEPDVGRFPCLQLAWDAARLGGTACAVLSAANDVAVDAYLHDRAKFADIPDVIRRTLAQHAPVDRPTLDQILAADDWARSTARRLLTA